MWLILDSLSEMIRGDDLCVSQIRNRPRHFQYPVHLLSAEVELFDSGFEQFPCGIVHHTLRLHLRRPDPGITEGATATQTLHLSLMRLFDPMPDRSGSLSLAAVHEDT